MSFLFGKKSKGEKTGATAPTRDGPAIGGPSLAMPPLNEARQKERGPGVSSPIPGGGVSSTNGNNTPSPEQNHDQKAGIEQDLQVCYNLTTRLFPIY